MGARHVDTEEAEATSRQQKTHVDVTKAHVDVTRTHVDVTSKQHAATSKQQATNNFDDCINIWIVLLTYQPI